MRKEEEPEQAGEAQADEAKPKSRPARKVVETEEEVSDTDLLGESTLAKLNTSRTADEAEGESKPEEAPKAE